VHLTHTRTFVERRASTCKGQAGWPFAAGSRDAEARGAPRSRSARRHLRLPGFPSAAARCATDNDLPSN
jgi:hypothetical protein